MRPASPLSEGPALHLCVWTIEFLPLKALYKIYFPAELPPRKARVFFARRRVEIILHRRGLAPGQAQSDHELQQKPEMISSL